jgi:hypothetical protein
VHINQDIEESLERDHSQESREAASGLQENADLTSGKLATRVDFGMRSEDERSPQFQQRDMLNDLGQGIKGQAQGASSVQDQYNPYTDNHYTNINFSDYAEIKEEPNEESMRQETEAEEPQPAPAGWSHEAHQAQPQPAPQTNAPTGLQKKSQFLLEQYRQAKSSKAQGAEVKAGAFGI